MNHNDQVEFQLSKLLVDRPPELSELAFEIRRHIINLVPNCSELIYATYAVSNVFTYTGKLGHAFIHIAVYAEHVNLGFNQGARLPDPDSILEGTGKLIRHIRIEDAAALKSKAVNSLIKSSIKLGKEMAADAGGATPQSFEVKTK